MAQLVARYLGVVEAAGSSPVTQTMKKDTERCLFSNEARRLAHEARFAYEAGLRPMKHALTAHERQEPCLREIGVRV